jgi:hypothetical protein
MATLFRHPAEAGIAERLLNHSQSTAAERCEIARTGDAWGGELGSGGPNI